MMKLTQTTTLRQQPLKNRIAMAPMTTYSGQKNLYPSQAEIDYMKLRACDVGLVISPAISINAQAQAFENQITLKSDAFIEPMRPFVKAMQSGGGKAIAQLHHGGRMNDPKLYQNHADIVSASAIKAPREGLITPRALSIEEIKTTIQDFAFAALRAIKAGFDGIELHGANTYLLQQFFSPHTNQRSDSYGGSLPKRLRFISEIIEAVGQVIDEHAPKPFIFGYRFSPEEIEPDGLTLDDTVYLLHYLKDTKLDYIHASMGHYAQSSLRDKTNKTPIVETFLKALDDQKPLMGSGFLRSFKDLKKAEDLGYDYMAIGLPLIADPKAVEKIINNQLPNQKIIKSSLPKPLYEKLYKNKARFKPRGITFD